MREVEVFHFHPGNSIWHRHDPRIKLLEISFWSIMALSAPFAVMGMIALILVCLLWMSGTRISQMKKPLMFWSIMALMITFSAGLYKGSADANIGKHLLFFSQKGLISGAVRSVRLLTVLMAGQFLSATTDSADLATAVKKILPFLPPSWSASIAMAISLTLASIPALLDEVATMRDAAFSRGLGNRRSPLRRSISLGLPMAEAVLRRADRTTEALISRGCSENPTPPEMPLYLSDILLGLMVILPPLVLMIFVD